MKAQDIKNSILQLAIQGKLVEQREAEGTAKELLKKIEAEKKQLIKEGKIKKQKDLPEIKEDEIPFDIPESWEWTRLGNIIYQGHQGINTAADKVQFKQSRGVPIIQTGDITNGFINLNGTKLMSEEDYLKYYDRYQPRYNNIFFCNIGTIGKPYIYKEDYKMLFHWNIFIIKYNDKMIIPDYLKWILDFAARLLMKNTDGTAMQFVSKKKLMNYVVALPPLEEQKRIVAKIEELMPYVEKYDVAYSEVVELNKKFPEDMQKSILQYAIQGKLVEQQKEDGTAEDLYKQIQEEKKKLIKEGKIKKTKELPEITEDEIPFDIPESWKWVRLGEIGEIVGGGTPKTGNSEFWNGGNIPWLTPADMKFVPGKYVENGERFITEQGLKGSSARLMPKGTIIYSSRAPIGYIAIAENNLATNQGFKSITPHIVSVNEYIYYCLIARTNEIISRASGTTFKEISGSEFGMTVVPLPPLEEQKRIVNKIEELLPYTKQLLK
jgi:type I restriction enzyme S subunit